MRTIEVFLGEVRSETDIHVQWLLLGCRALHGSNLAKMAKTEITILQKGSYPKETNRAYMYHTLYVKDWC